MVTLIAAFEVPPDADGAFVASWEHVLATHDGIQEPALHRALRTDVDFRYVAVAHVESARAIPDDPTFPAHPGLYDVVRLDGTPDVAGGVVLINPFELTDEDDERFLAGWDRARDALARQRGYLGTRLHRSVGPADFRFVNIARWSSPLMFARALKEPDFQQAAQALPFPSHPALYQVVGE